MRPAFATACRDDEDDSAEVRATKEGSADVPSIYVKPAKVEEYLHENIVE